MGSLSVIRKESKRPYKKRRKQKPVIKITSDMLSVCSVVLDAGILALLVLWFVLEITGTIGAR